MTALSASTDPNTQKFRFTASSTVLDLTAATGGAGGDALTFSTTVLGTTVSGPTLSGGDPSRLRCDFPQIQAFIAPFMLATLRAEPRKAALNKAINARQNAYFAKYANQGLIIAKMDQYYFNPPDFNLPGPVNIWSKSARLAVLSETNEELWAALNGAYASVGRDGATGVADGTVSKLSSDITSYGYAATSSTTDEAATSDNVPAGGIVHMPAPPDPWKPPTAWPPPPNPPPVTPPTATAADWDGGWNPTLSGNNETASYQKTSSYEANSSNGLAHQDQSITTSNSVFRHPYYEAKAKYERAQISLVDQQFAAFMYAQNVPNLLELGPGEAAGHIPDVAGGGSPYGPIMSLPRGVNSAIGGQWGRYASGFTFDGFSLIDRSTGQFLYISHGLEEEPTLIFDFR